MDLPEREKPLWDIGTEQVKKFVRLVCYCNLQHDNSNVFFPRTNMLLRINNSANILQYQIFVSMFVLVAKNGVFCNICGKKI